MAFTFKTPRILRRFRRGEGGVAAVEFALLAPLMVLLLIGSTEVTHLIWASGRLNATTAAMGNVLTQERTLNDSVFSEVMNAAPMIMRPYENNSLSFEVVSAVACYESGHTRPTYVVSWSRGWENGSTVPGPFAPKRRISTTDMAELLGHMVLPLDDSVIIVRSRYVYSSKGSLLFSNGQVSAFKPTYNMVKNVTYQPRIARRLFYSGVEADPQLTCASLLSS